MSKFYVGDLVTGNELADIEYAITTSESVCKVVEMTEDDIIYLRHRSDFESYIMVKLVSTTNLYYISEIGNRYPVKRECFKLA